MDKRYTVNELKNIVNLSHQAIYNRINSSNADKRFRTSVERVDSRKTTFILLNDDEMEDLIKEVGVRLNVESTFNKDDSIETSYSRVHETPTVPVEVLDKLFDKFNDFTQHLNQVHKEYKDEIVNTSLQVRLLEDSESRTKKEYQEIQSENQHLKELNQDLLNKLNQLELDLESAKKENEELKEKVSLFEKRNFWTIFKNK